VTGYYKLADIVYDGIIVTNVHGNITDLDKYVNFVMIIIKFYYSITQPHHIHFIEDRIRVILVMDLLFHFITPSHLVLAKRLYHCRQTFEKNIRCSLNFGIDNSAGDMAKYSNQASNIGCVILMRVLSFISTRKLMK